MALRIKKRKQIEISAGVQMVKKKGNPVYNLNRPVHLARSSIFLEKARKSFQECMGKVSPKRRVQLIDSSLYYLQLSLEHAMLAAKSTQTNPLEDSVVAFIRLMVIWLYSIRLLLDTEFQLDDNKSLLWQFLHLRGKAKQAVKFARSGEQLLEDMGHIFKVSQEPYEDLQRTLLEHMSEAERARYKLAYDGLHNHLVRSRPIPRAERFFQIFLPAPEMRSE